MDPLSVTAGVLGILMAAGKVSSALNGFIKNTKNAPKRAQEILGDVNAFSGILSQLQAYLFGRANSSPSRASMILIEQVIVTLTECVTTFSELEDALGTADSGSEMTILNRARWAMKEKDIIEIHRKLQNNKSSLTLMLTILQW